MDANNVVAVRASVDNILQPVQAQRNEPKDTEEDAYKNANEVTQSAVLVAQLCDNVTSTVRASHAYWTTIIKLKLKIKS